MPDHERPKRRRWRRISPRRPATITIYPDAVSVDTARARVVSFESLTDAAEFFDRPVKVDDKRMAPLFARAAVVGNRKKLNLRAPFLATLDADETEVPMVEAVERLEAAGIACVAHTTWSHGKRAGVHSYRIFPDLTADDWRTLETLTRVLFEICGVEPTRESWKSPCFFVPAAPERRRRLQRFLRTGLEESEIAACDELAARMAAVEDQTAGLEPEERDRNTDPGIPPRAEDPPDVGEIAEALSRVPNADREDWIRVGMALRASGLEDATARDLWDRWSAGAEDAAPEPYGEFSEEAQETAWRSFSDRPQQGGVGLGSLFLMARRHGWRPQRERTDPREDFAEVLDPRATQLAGLNRRYAFVGIGQGAVADFGAPEDGRTDHPVGFKSTRAFLGLHAHPRIPSGEVRADGEPIMWPIGRVWLERFPRRRSYDEVDFLPEGGPEALPASTLNLWRGWPDLPTGPGSAEPWLEHARDVICGGNRELWDWTLAWCAHLVQRPWEKPGTAIVLRGNEGVGKGVFCSALVDLCGPHGIHVTQPRQLTGNFNAHASAKLLIFADEVTWGGRHQEEGVLKGMITERRQVVEQKGVDAFSARSFCRLLISSNNEWVVPAGVTARRFLVMDVGQERMQDLTYFGRIQDNLKTGGWRDLLGRLRAVELAKLPDPRRAVGTDALIDQKVRTLESKGTWLLSFLKAGKISDYAAGWPEGPFPISDLHDSYLESARATGVNRRAIEMEVTAFLQKVLGPQFRRGRTSVDGKQVRSVELPPLAACRTSFEAWLGGEIDWT